MSLKSGAMPLKRPSSASGGIRPKLHSAADRQPLKSGVGVSACGRNGEKGDRRRSVALCNDLKKKQSATLRQQPLRSAFADTPARRYADTALQRLHRAIESSSLSCLRGVQ
jgi:hypothetical protein